MKPKKLKLTEKDKSNEIAEKYLYRGYEIHMVKDGIFDGSQFYFTEIVCPDNIPLADYSNQSDETDVMLENACDWLDHQLDDPKEALKRLRKTDTATLVNIFYTYAISAPSWADELMEMVAERKKRSWLINKISHILTDDELIEEMGV